MFRLSGWFCIFMAALCGTLLFWTSQSVQHAEHELTKVEKYNAYEMETLRVLSAEWDYLNRPERLEMLTLKNLDMDEVHAQGDSFLTSAQDIPQPFIPVLPKIKPDFIQPVTTAKTSNPEIIPPTIQNIERERFNQLVADVTQEGQ